MKSSSGAPPIPNPQNVFTKTLFTSEQIQQRVSEMARQISKDYAGKSLYVVCRLEEGFMFMADLVRQLELPVACEFVRAETRLTMQGTTDTKELFFGPEFDVRGKNVLLVEALVQTGITSEFLIRNFTTRGAASVKLAAFIDKQADRRTSLQPDYFGFLVRETYVAGYGLGASGFGGNLPYIGIATRS